MVLFLVQNNNKVTGTFDVPLGGGTLSYLTGDVNGNRLDFQFFEVGYGTNKVEVNGNGFLILSSDGKSVAGEVVGRYKDGEFSGKWKGDKFD